jgi:hypothetical protein
VIVFSHARAHAVVSVCVCVGWGCIGEAHVWYVRRVSSVLAFHSAGQSCLGLAVLQRLLAFRLPLMQLLSRRRRLPLLRRLVFAPSFALFLLRLAFLPAPPPLIKAILPPQIPFPSKPNPPNLTIGSAGTTSHGFHRCLCCFRGRRLGKHHHLIFPPAPTPSLPGLVVISSSLVCFVCGGIHCLIRLIC